MKDVIRFAVVERFCRILSAMLKAGVPVPEAMTAALEATNNRVYSSALIAHATPRFVARGSPGRSPRPTCSHAAQKMLLVGEQSGTLDTQLDATAATARANGRTA